MFRELRDYWLPLMLFAAALITATLLLILVAVMPFIAEQFAITNELLNLFAEDAVVSRSSIAGAIGLIVTAFVFFRPSSSALARNSSTQQQPDDTMAGA